MSSPTQPIASEFVASRSANTFTVVWTGGDGATSYTYSLNGNDVIPSYGDPIAYGPTINGSYSVTFGALPASTTYTVIVTATNEYGSTSSDPFTATSGAGKGTPTGGDPISPIQGIYIDNVTTTVIGESTYVSGFTLHWQGGERSGKQLRYTYTADGLGVITPDSSSTMLGPYYATFGNLGSGIIIPLSGVTLGIEEDSGFAMPTLAPVNATAYFSLSEPPTQPVVTVGTVTGSSISLSWTDGDGATSYIYSLNGAQAYPTNDNGVNGKSATFTGVTPSTTYAIIVTAVNDGGSSSNSPPVTVTTLSPPAPPTTQAITNLTNTFATAIVSTGESATTEEKIQAASSAIANALANNVAPETLVAAALTIAADSPAIFTALVSNPVFVGASISVPSTVAQTLYASFAIQTNLDTTLPLKVNFPGADGKVTPPVSGTNSKLAIDLCGNNTYVPFRGCTGYGIHVVDGEQYFTTPSNPVGTLVHVGDIISFTIDGGGTIVSKIADLDIVLIPYTAPRVICFLPSAPVLTPSGYCRIDSLRIGDVVCTREGDTTAIIESIQKQVYMPGPDTNPYVIPAGRFGSNSRLLISPRHKVSVNGEMIEARDLGLEQEEQYEKITYYNLQVTCSENIIVAGIEVESLQALTRINIPMETFNYIIMNKYGGKISDEIKERCHLMPDGTISVPMLV